MFLYEAAQLVQVAVVLENGRRAAGQPRVRLAADRVRIVRVHEVGVDALVRRVVGRVRHLLKFAAFYPLLSIVLPILLAHGGHP